MNDQNDRAELARLLPPPQAPALLQQRQAELRTDLLQRIDAAAPRAGRARVRWPMVAVPLALAAAVTAVLVVVPALVRPEAGPSAEDRTVASVLARAAQSAIAVPSNVRPDQYIYVKSRNQWRGHRADSDGKVTELPGPEYNIVESWLAMDPAKQSFSRMNGAPLRETSSYNESTNPRTHHFEQTKLPTDPDQLLAWLYQDIPSDKPRDLTAFRHLSDLLKFPVASPAVLSAIYRAAAKIPGVQLVGETVDGLGRPALAVGFLFDNGADRLDLLFHRDSFDFLGERKVTLRDTGYGKAGEVRGPEEIIRRAVVDKPGQLP
ncbi:CU044_5270 family protein [Crossiella sp. SN42]|uniref:CU044_5270 family protein n=1 Tax=Crossiella sp. SN42 TaxID=2944808 RepID=UPI00207D4B43|nr:CU044_5270 family protein [Crossiella sp. SN42]MCO1576163.1 CU044_5270 family protein [Crossiella sp. SN42]